MATPVSYAKAIRPLFRQIDIDHMKPFDVKLDEYNWMSDSAGAPWVAATNIPIMQMRAPSSLFSTETARRGCLSAGRSGILTCSTFTSAGLTMASRPNATLTAIERRCEHG
jgi:hypothetical protein